MITEEELKKYDIQSISLLSEASFVPRISIRHMDGHYSYLDVSRNEIEDIKAGSWGQPEYIEQRIKAYLIELRRQDRKKKLDKIYSK